MAADEGSSIQLGSKIGTAAYDDGRLQLLYFVCFFLYNMHGFLFKLIYMYIYMYYLWMYWCL